MPELWFAVPGDPETLTGGYIYAAKLTAALTAAGWTVHRLMLPPRFPFPTTADIAVSREILDSVPKDAPLLIDGLAYGVLPAAILERLGRIAALVHHPLALETGLAADDRRRFVESERIALGFARAVITTSTHTAIGLAADYAVPHERLFVAPPGTDPASRSRGSRTPCLLTVATVTPRKGHDVLAAALSRLTDLAWTCCIAGSLTRAPETAAALRAQIGRSGVAERITLTGAVTADALERLYLSADIFVLPSRYEGYGMAFAEALAHGLPVVGCRGGAVSDTVPEDAGFLVRPDDPDALAGALRALLAAPEVRARKAEAAWRRGQALPRWSDTAQQVIAALAAA